MPPQHQNLYIYRPNPNINPASKPRQHAFRPIYAYNSQRLIYAIPIELSKLTSMTVGTKNRAIRHISVINTY